MVKTVYQGISLEVPFEAKEEEMSKQRRNRFGKAKMKAFNRYLRAHPPTYSDATPATDAPPIPGAPPPLRLSQIRPFRRLTRRQPDF